MLLLILTSGGPESSAVPQATTSSTPIASSTSPATSKSNAGAIAGGVIGGVAFFGIVAGLVTFIVLRRRKRSSSSGLTPSTYSSVGSPGMGYADGSNFPASMGPGKVYVSLVEFPQYLSDNHLAQDPNDPSTFPTSDSLGYSPYSASPALTANPAAARTQYTGVPELWWVTTALHYTTFSWIYHLCKLSPPGLRLAKLSHKCHRCYFFFFWFFSQTWETFMYQ